MRLASWIVASSLLLFLDVWSSGLFAQENSTTVYGIVIERDSGQEARVVGALLTFIRSDGLSTAIHTDATGQYRIKLPSDYAYSVRVSGRGFCPTGRPQFNAKARTAVLFNFTLTTNCPGDVVIIPDGSIVQHLADESDDRETAQRKVNAMTQESPVTAFCANARVYYCDEQIAFKTTKVMPVTVRFVTREVHDHQITYGSHLPPSVSNPERTLPVALFSVIVEFDTTTISADTATLDLKTGYVVAKGNLSIIQDSEQIPPKSDCMTISINDPKPVTQPCE